MDTDNALKLVDNSDGSTMLSIKKDTVSNTILNIDTGSRYPNFSV